MRAASDVSRRINAERLLLIAWVRAILLQFAHPLIAAGVAQHSTFRRAPGAASARLRHTLGAMLALTFGTDAERDAAVDGIRAIHRRVRGTLAHACGPFPAGTRYSAEDPALLTWVHATLLESMVLVYEQLIGPLSVAERDRYCDDAAELALALGALPGEVPRSWRELRAYIDAQFASGHIVVGDDALSLSNALLCPIPGPFGSIITFALSHLAAGLLPERVRLQYAFEWNRQCGRRFARIMSTLRRMRRVLPRSIVLWKAARSGQSIPLRRRSRYAPG
jgi:uncharacterized protein (DUF2236 family)